ncbi:putative cystathionine gamma-lyase 2 [Phlebotomus argentipes]|uniref:putative cystathionine gamma-lyase 2 n=1 Tax=Phlebotomus argentipes TaxID=94469 RepID=UPI002893398B|nr:putative cystathionine gamma-lyase 2 [Phlebotomus argentipes]
MVGKDFSEQEGFRTAAIHTGHTPKSLGDPVIPPIVNSTIYRYDAIHNDKDFEYTRVGNPTRTALEQCLATLDDGKYALTFSSGQGATTSITHLMSPHDHILVSRDLYTGTEGLMSSLGAQKRVDVEFFNAVDLEELKRLLKPSTRMVWLESPTNPHLVVVDIRAISDIAHNYNKNIIVVVDNSFLSSYFQRPLNFGADISMYSLTKFMNGHSDVLMGAAVTNCQDIYERLKRVQVGLGIVPSPFDCFLMHRSLKTLGVRMEKHHENSLAVAKFLQKHPKIEKVLHPALPDNPRYSLTLRQTYGHSGIMAFYLRGGIDEVKKFASKLKYITIAKSLGGVESTIVFPHIMMYERFSEEEKINMGISVNFARMSIGIEDHNVLINDLDQALNSLPASPVSKL